MSNKSSGESLVAKSVRIWLFIGLVMVFIQVIVGGITRLTGSGLSITKWEIITGTLPPMNAAQWETEFELYKDTPQYKEINQGMNLKEFKFIYFWEYIHRLWARSMGFVFLIPFLIFWRKGMLPRSLLKDLGIVVFIAAVVASFGWIMVKSGLVDRPWVNAYKLTIHLSLAFILYSYLLWSTFKVTFPHINITNNLVLKKWSNWILAFLSVQIVLGGLMSGIKAGVFYPTWPDMHGEIIPSVLLTSKEWNVDNIINYDKNLFIPALVQLLHRSVAYILTFIVLYFSFKAFKLEISQIFKGSLLVLISVLVTQVLLGIFTLINCQGSIPVGLGVLHQGCALLLLSAMLFVRFQLRSRSN